MAVVSMATRGKYDTDSVTTTRCSLTVEVTRSVGCRAHLLKSDYSGDAMNHTYLVMQDCSEEFILQFHYRHLKLLLTTRGPTVAPAVLLIYALLFSRFRLWLSFPFLFFLP